jgi:hypothetical protein
MGKLYNAITPELSEWISQQQVFFVATAPLSPTGHINCSPKGGDSFRVIDSLTVVYQDLTGSGAETIAHLRENGRLVIMFCAFEGPPQIVRLSWHGRGGYPGRPGVSGVGQSLSASHPGTRSLIRLKVSRISDSCGYGVPLMDFREPRETLRTWSVNKGPEKLKAYQQEKNSRSIDGLPALEN